MGFFSWNCKRCGLAIMSPYSVDSENVQLNDAVAITQEGEVFQGEYDGHGHLGDMIDDELCNNPEMYHQVCWELAGKPTEYTEGSENASNQGFFINDRSPEAKAKNQQNKFDFHTISCQAISNDRKNL